MAKVLKFLPALLLFLLLFNFKAIAQTDTLQTASGLKYVILKTGHGKTPVPGQKVRVHYKGWLTSGRVFDTSEFSRKPLRFKIGEGEVIPGWDEMLQLMQEGQKVVVVIPPELAYGNRTIENPDVYGEALIPANSTLIFEIELLDVK